MGILIAGFIVYWISHFFLSFIDHFFPMNIDPDHYGWIGVGVVFVPLTVIGLGMQIWEKILEWRLLLAGYKDRVALRFLPPIKTNDEKTGRVFKKVTDVLIQDFEWTSDSIGPSGQEYTLDMHLGKPALKPHPSSGFRGSETYALLSDLLPVGTKIRFDKSFVEPVFKQEVLYGGDLEKADKMVWTNHLKENLNSNQTLSCLFNTDLIVEEFGHYFLGVRVRSEKSRDLVDLTFYFLTLPRAVYLSREDTDH